MSLITTNDIRVYVCIVQKHTYSKYAGPLGLAHIAPHSIIHKFESKY